MRGLRFWKSRKSESGQDAALAPAAVLLEAHPVGEQAETSAVNGPAAAADEMELLAALKRGDEAAFASLIDRYNSSLLRIAMMYVPNREVAEDVVQETWMGVLQGLDRFEGRSSLKTWIFRILTNRAQTRGKREARTIPFSSLATAEDEETGASVEPERFTSADGAGGHWTRKPADWADIPEESLIAGETMAEIRAAVEALPKNQRNVVTLRDIDQWTSEEVCSAMGITETNQRVLLHRGRTKVRKALEQYFESGR